MSTENEVEVLGEKYSYRDCCCFQCDALAEGSVDPDCACDAFPVYSKLECKECPKGAWCDTSRNPHDYEHDQDCVCVVCVSIQADYERLAMGEAVAVKSDEIVRLRSLMQRFTWIPITQSLPDSDQTVIVYCPESNEPIWLGYLDGDAWRDIDAMPIAHQAPVTHWMPLPEPPEAV